MRRVAQGLAVLLVACAGAPPPAVQKPERVAVVEVKPEPEKPEPPEPLAAEDVELTQTSEFIALSLGSIQPKLLTDDELLRRLPAAAKREFQAVERARASARDARAKENQVAAELYGCHDCKPNAALEIKHKVALKAVENAQDVLYRAKAHAEKSLDKQLDAPKAAPEIGIALARIESRGFELAADDGSSPAVEYAEEQPSARGADALGRALPLAGPDQEPGQRVRQELLNRLWSKRGAARARQIIDELLAFGPREWRAELRFRTALFDALDGHDAKAAEAFEQGLREHVSGSGVTRETLATGALFARYRALDFERTLGAAMRVFEEADRPAPPPPEPPAAPVAKPTPTKKWSKRPSPAAARNAALLANFGMLGMFSSSVASRLGERGVGRLAADAVERLGRDPTSIVGPVRAKAAVLSLLAARALYRNDVVKARRLAEAARSLGALAETRNAIKVLHALALRDDDMPRAKALQEQASKLPWGGATFGHQAEPDLRDLEAYLRDSKSVHSKVQGRNDKAKEPEVANNVRSALRVCLEPVRKRLPAAIGTGKDRLIATVTLIAKVFEDGHAELDVDADRKEDGIAQVLACLKGLGPHALAHAPSSVSAKIVLNDSARFGSTWGGGLGIGSIGGLFGEGELSQSFGSGGLGLRGSGGGGGTGRGYGGMRLGGKKPMKKPVAKPPPTPPKPAPVAKPATK